MYDIKLFEPYPRAMFQTHSPMAGLINPEVEEAIKASYPIIIEKLKSFGIEEHELKPFNGLMQSMLTTGELTTTFVLQNATVVIEELSKEETKRYHPFVIEKLAMLVPGTPQMHVFTKNESWWNGPEHFRVDTTSSYLTYIRYMLGMMDPDWAVYKDSKVKDNGDKPTGHSARYQEWLEACAMYRAEVAVMQEEYDLAKYNVKSLKVEFENNLLELNKELKAKQSNLNEHKRQGAPKWVPD